MKDKLIALLESCGHLGTRMVAALEAEGFERTWRTGTGWKLWEHAAVTEYNAKLTGAAFLDSRFCTLYESEYEFEFVIGRLGNTAQYVLRKPPVVS